MPSTMQLDTCGRRRSPATLSSFHQGRPPRNKGQRYPADPPTVEEIIAVMHAAGDDNDAVRLRGVIIVPWRAGLRISEALALNESDLDLHRGAILVRRGKGGKRREVGIDRWAWEQLTPWLQLHPHLAPQWVSRGRPLTRASHPAMSSPGCLPRQPSGHERARLVGAREARRSHTCSRERVKLSGPHSRLFRRRARPPTRRAYEARARPRRWLRSSSREPTRRSSSAARAATWSSSVISDHNVERRLPVRRTFPAASPVRSWARTRL